MKSKLFLKTVRSLVLVSTLIFSMCSNPQSVSSFRGDNENSGIYENSEISNPTLKWKCNLNGAVFSSPAISEGVAYIGSGDNHLYSINTVNGTVNWKFKTNGDIHSSPAVYDGTVFFTSMDGNIYAIDKICGREEWAFKTEGEKQYSAINMFGYDTKGLEFADPWDFYLSSPVIENDIVYFGSGDSHIYALNANSGEEIWKFKTGDVVHSSPAISNGIVYCGSFDSKLYALDAITGKEIWTYQAGTDEKYHLMCGIQASPSVSNGTVYFGSRDAYIYAIDAISGELKWKQKFGGSWMPSSTSVTEDKVYVGSSDARKFFALNKETGSIIDSVKTHSFTFSSPAVSGNTVYIGVFNGFLHAINKNNGKIKWTFNTDACKTGLGEHITDDGKVKKEFYSGISFKEFDNMQKSLDRFFSVGAIVSSPVIDNGTLYFSSADGYLYAIN